MKKGKSIKILRKYDVLNGDKIDLREIRESDIEGGYLNWLKDSNVTKYLETRFSKYSRNKLKDYVLNIINNSDNILFAIIAKDSNKHIGNIKLGPINWVHRFAYIGIMIGIEEYWGKGIGREAISIVSTYAFSKLKLNKIMAGIYEVNIGSIRAFEKAGFRIEARINNHYEYQGKYIASIIMSLDNV